MNLTRIAERALNAPLLIDPRKAGAIARLLLPRIAAGNWQLEGPRAFVDDEGEPDWALPAGASILGGELDDAIEQRRLRGFAVRDGVAVIGVSGTLVHRGAWLGRSSGQTSYEGLAAQIDAAARDPEVRGIALEVDSFGGEVAGCFDLADRIREARAAKPVRAFLAENAASAAYALASQAEAVTLPRTGEAGSIGVVCLHADFSGMLAQDGVTVTLIHAGRHKVDGNPYQPLPDDVAADLTVEMETLRTLFAATVAAGRGNKLGAAAALETEARCFMGQAAVDAGLADAVAEPRAAFEEFVAEVSGRARTPAATAASAEESAMNRATKATASRRAEDPGDEEDEDEAAQAAEADVEAETDAEAMDPDDEDAMDGEDGDDEEGEDGDSAAAAGERRRIAAILDAPEAHGRDGLARHLAFRTSMTAGQAIKALGASARAASKLSRAMQGRSPAPVRGGGDGNRDAADATADRILANAGRLKKRS